jgi:hypothetical protein
VRCLVPRSSSDSGPCWPPDLRESIPPHPLHRRHADSPRPLSQPRGGQAPGSPWVLGRAPSPARRHRLMSAPATEDTQRALAPTGRPPRGSHPVGRALGRQRDRKPDDVELREATSAAALKGGLPRAVEGSRRRLARGCERRRRLGTRLRSASHQCSRSRPQRSPCGGLGWRSLPAQKQVWSWLDFRRERKPGGRAPSHRGLLPFRESSRLAGRRSLEACGLVGHADREDDDF